MTKTTCKYPKFYICKYGAFYEGEILEQYCCQGSYYYYVNDIILKKFVVHYVNYLPRLFFVSQELNKTRTFTLPVEQLGVNYRKIRKR